MRRQPNHGSNDSIVAVSRLTRSARFGLPSLVGFIGASGLALAFGCTSFEGSGGASGTSSSTTGTDTSSPSSSSSGVAPGCEPVQGQAIPPECGIFVAAGGKGDGSQESPLGSVMTALSKGQGKPVYICASTSPLIEAIEIDGSATLFGGFDCSSWLYKGTHAKLKAPIGSTALTIRGASTTVSMSDFDVTAVDATTPSSSSIAALIDQSTVHLTRMGLFAGGGAGGANGMPKASLGVAPNGGAGTTGCASSASNTGGMGGQNTCGINVSGGNGGKGGAGAAYGSPGTVGNGPAGGPLGEGEDLNGLCHAGAQGGAGTAGTPGPGATTSDPGTLDATGYTGPVGGAGLGTATPGSGGGGGGGDYTCGPNNAFYGPSGGGGGAGGCGGAPGDPGKGGGGSFGLISFNAMVTLDTVTIQTGSGGVGGTGDGGQPGQAGGPAGNAGGPGNPGTTTGSCAGGPGGPGGRGGAGGGGRGGPSVGIATVGIAPVETSVTISVSPTPAPGGPGGNGGTGNQGGLGAAGIVAPRQSW